jgi:hypothetical protein
MKPNVFITARDRGKISYRWEGHNVWVERGRQYLAQMLSLSSHNPDVPVIPSSRLKHIQYGIGGVTQELGSIPANVNTAYPVGEDPQATDGHSYNHLFPIDPLITTLERPVRISGGTNPYDTAPNTDVWLTGTAAPKFLVTVSSSSVSLRYFVSGSSGDIAYAPFTNVPITEAGLTLSGEATPNAPFSPIVAYVNFSPVRITATLDVEFVWTVGF